MYSVPCLSLMKQLCAELIPSQVRDLAFPTTQLADPSGLLRIDSYTTPLLEL